MSIWSRVNELRAEEGMLAGLAVRCIQTGRDPQRFIEQAGALRAECYEFRATGNVLLELQGERHAELRRRYEESCARRGMSV